MTSGSLRLVPERQDPAGIDGDAGSLTLTLVLLISSSARISLRRTRLGREERTLEMHACRVGLGRSAFGFWLQEHMEDVGASSSRRLRHVADLFATTEWLVQ
jgi:hypothetical protein